MSTQTLILLPVAFVALALLETFFPHTPRKWKRLQRWPGNLGLFGASQLALWAAVPPHPNSPPSLLGWGLTVVAMDFFIYLQHLLFHRVPLLWAIHRVHHTDQDLDVTSAVRFHPVEMAISAYYKLFVILLLGAGPESVVAFEGILKAMAMFNHANLSLPPKVERAIRAVFVTPQMHLVHHSATKEEANSNYGFCLSIWDRLLGTYRENSHGPTGQGVVQNGFWELLGGAFPGPRSKRVGASREN